MADRNAKEFLNSGEVKSVKYGDQSGAPEAKPSYQEGLVFYDAAAKTISAYIDVPDTTLNIGQETYIRVINNTGVTITDGQPLYQIGVVNGLPSVAPAIANTFVTSAILGVATHTIVDSAEGVITIVGTISGLDTSLYGNGDSIYLSDTAAGEWVTTPPDIASLIGLVTVSDALDGKILVRIANGIALPPIMGYVQGVARVFNLSTANQPIDNYVGGGGLVIKQDLVVGTLTTPLDGFYRFTASVPIIYDTENSTETVTIDLIDSGDNVIASDTITRPQTNEDATINATLRINYPHVTIGPDVYSLRIRASNTVDVTVGDASFDIESILLR